MPAATTSQRRIRIFLDSNVLTGGIVSSWGLDKGTLSLCAAKVCKLVLAEAVREEVEENLLLHAARLGSLDAEQLIEDYRHLIKLTNPELVPYPDKDLVHSRRHLIRHEADVPVLLSAMASKPDWLLTHNTRRFTKAVALRTSLRRNAGGILSRAFGSFAVSGVVIRLCPVLAGTFGSRPHNLMEGPLVSTFLSRPSTLGL